MKKTLFCLFCTLLGSSAAVTQSLWDWGKEDFYRGQNLSLESLEFSVIVVDRNGDELYRNFTNENRQWVELEDIPLTLQLATIVLRLVLRAGLAKLKF